MKQFLGLGNARCVSVHEVDVRLSLGKLVPLGRLQEILQRRSSMYLVQPMQDMRNIVIIEVRHEEQIFASSSR
jgi:hypothetical protein